MNGQIITLWPANLRPEFLDSVINFCETFPVQEAAIGFDGNSVNNQYRKSDIRWINTYDLNAKFITETLWNYAVDANRNNFGFDINYLRDIQYTTYKSEQNGKYDWHEDVFWLNPTAYHRKLSVVIQLTDPSEYEGGCFEIDSQFGVLDQQEIKKRGTVLIFPSFVRHRVTPVTSGQRKSLVAWIEGPKWR